MPEVNRTMIDRILLVLDRCLESDAPVPLASLCLDCRLPKATAWRIAESLARRGLLTRSGAGYVAGAGVIERGDRASHQSALRAFVVPELVELHRRTNGAVWAVDVRKESEWVVIAQIYDRTALRDRYHEDWRHDPTHPGILATSLGRVGLVDSDERVHELLRRGVPRLTPRTEVEPRRVLAALERARAERHIVEHGGVWLGWSCLAVPVLDAFAQRTVGVVGVMNRTPRFIDHLVARAAHDTADRLRSLWPRSTPDIG